MAEDQFKKAEDDYFRLKGQLAAGRITQSQFEAGLKDLMVQDEQGQYWMLGVESAKWYVHDGKNWVEAQPPSGSPPSIPEANLSLSAASSAGAPKESSRNLRVMAISLAVLICACAAIGVALFVISRQDPLQFVFNRAAPPTFPVPAPILVPTVTPLATNTLVPVATTTLSPSPTSLPSATPTITPIPTVTPRPQGNCTDPGAQWENVTDGQRIDPYASMQGTANATDFDEYVVEYLRPGNVLHRSRTPVVHNILFVWNTYTVSNGDYLLALIVYLKDGSNLAPCVIRVRVQH